MGGAEEEWVKAAMTDDMMVVELLVRLHCTPPTPPPPTTLPLEWTVRQRRSRPVSVNTKRLTQSHRASPSTPLSWSGGSAGAGGGGGVSEDSSRPQSQKLSSATRSKLNGDNEKAGSKRSRKKKTLAQLKDEETSLLKERRELKRDISALRINLEKQRAQNEKLKRIKIESLPLPDKETSGATARVQQKTTADHPNLPITPPIIPGNAVALHCSTQQNADTPFSPPFVLPDLNMPFEDPCPDVICFVS